jgi:hypothetical protein
MKVAIALVILLAAPGAVLAQSPDGQVEAADNVSWETVARTELEFVELTMVGDGWTLDRRIDAAGLGDEETGYMPVRLDNGGEYAIVALCDEHCGDMDLALYDEADALVGEDCAEAGLPIVHVRPEERARYELEVRMFNCAEESCRYSVAVFSRPGRVTFGER